MTTTEKTRRQVQIGKRIYDEALFHMLGCNGCGIGWAVEADAPQQILDQTLCRAEQPCTNCEGIIERLEDQWIQTGMEPLCTMCDKPGEEQYSLGLYAGVYCHDCWGKTSYRKEGRFSPADAGESY